MKPIIFSCAAWAVFTSIAIAQPPNDAPTTGTRAEPPPTDQRQTPTQPPPAVSSLMAQLLQEKSLANTPADRQITLEILIAAVAEPTDNETASQLLKMEKAGKFKSVARLQLTSSVGKQAQVQIKRSAPADRAATGTANDATSAKAAGGPRSATQPTTGHSDVFLAATAQTVSHLDENGAVVVELKIEFSRMVDAKRRDSAAPNRTGDDLPPVIETITIDSTVALRPDEPQIISGSQSAAGTDTAQTRVVITAHVSAAAEKRTEVFPLKYANSDSATEMLRKMISKSSVKCTSDALLNVIYVTASPLDIRNVEQLIKLIDRDTSSTAPQPARPRFIPILHSKAADIALLVRGQFAGRIADADNQSQAKLEDSQQSTPFGGGGGGRGSAGGVAGNAKMTISVAQESNSLIVSAPDRLFEEVKAFVAILDKAKDTKLTTP